ncbi:Gamma-tubulin complex component [Caenorhabditis elegans]|uniref:Gamma-tubulin complex component n=1 Tax=Caenorhabditis elegans TaxID=6239 RepID=O61208_CAEEL|nr:Gamma-tubulin complex component [Caenorhabditis elegans]AAM34494.1 gamma-tubulin ring protein GRIP-1 [Caenorhabditis elegans]CCD72177.1 Gamma-tubulin complex component [Caenorhabditis elegans]|eukprot:NP_001022632.1 Gamma-tubulin complex component [Caenorhabditis elegans]
MRRQGSEEVEAVQQFLNAFGFHDRDVIKVQEGLFHSRQLNDVNASRTCVDQFVKKCELRDPNGIKPLRKKIDALMNESVEMNYMMDFLVRCRQAHLFHNETIRNSPSIGLGSIGGTPTNSIPSSSPFQRRSASRGRVLSTLTGDQQTPSIADSSSRSRANSSFTAYDNRMLGMERQLAGNMAQRPRSPYTINGIPTTRVQPISASNQLFTASNGFTPPNPHLRTTSRREESPSSSVFPHNSDFERNRGGAPNRAHQLRHPTTSHLLNTSVTSSIRANVNSNSNTPIHSRIGSAITETESNVCECLLSALLGIETRLFTPIHREMKITSTASLSTTHQAVCSRILPIANTYLLLSHKEPNNTGQMTEALMAAIRRIIGDYITDIDALRRTRGIKFYQCLPLIDMWQNRLRLLKMAYKIRNLPQLELLENLYILHAAYSFDSDQKSILDVILDYTLGVFCNQMMEWMTTGEIPTSDKWIIEKNEQSGELFLRKIPIFITDSDARILLEIGKSLPHVESASDSDLEAIDKATTVVRTQLGPKAIFSKILGQILRILRDVVCGIVMRMVMETGRLKEHVLKSTSFFFLSDPRFTTTLYTIIKEASQGLRVGSTTLSRQTVSSALAAALESCQSTQNISDKEKKVKKLMFTLDALTSTGSTPNVSSRMQFVQPLRPRYAPQMDLMKPIFSACDDAYESIFHVIWSIDLARCSTQDASSQNLPEIQRFLIKNYSLRENATCLLNMLAHVFSIINSTLLRVRCHVSVQLARFLARFLAAIDEKCVDVDDVIAEHRRFVHRATCVVFLKNSDQIEKELATLVRSTFDAQEFTQEFGATWRDVIESTGNDENARKARIAEICQKKTIGARNLMDSVNTTQRKLNELLDEQITYGNDALLD